MAKAKTPRQPKGATSKQEEKKVDTSPKVYQREKISYHLNIRELPWSAKQKAFLDLMTHRDTRIAFLEGPAGSSKTTVAMRAALQLLNDHKIGEVILVRAAVESSDSHIGLLPGDVSSKIGVYMEPFMAKLEELLTKPDRDKLHAEERLVSKPVSFCRGASWAAKFVIIDEAQSMTFSELNTLLTRIGKFSKVVILSDSSQSDLPFNKRGGVEACTKIFDTEAARAMGIFSLKFTADDIVRSELCKFVVETFDKYKAEKDLEQLIKYKDSLAQKELEKKEKHKEETYAPGDSRK